MQESSCESPLAGGPQDHRSTHRSYQKNVLTLSILLCACVRARFPSSLFDVSGSCVVGGTVLKGRRSGPEAGGPRVVVAGRQGRGTRRSSRGLRFSNAPIVEEGRVVSTPARGLTLEVQEESAPTAAKPQGNSAMRAKGVRGRKASPALASGKAARREPRSGEPPARNVASFREARLKASTPQKNTSKFLLVFN
jgi:hypothetical protein